MFAERIARRVHTLEGLSQWGFKIFLSYHRKVGNITPQFRSVSYPIHNSKITHPLDPTKHKNLKNSLNKLRMNHEQDWVKDTLKIVFSAFKFFKIKFLSSVGNE